jgi:vancomycin resistance protein YoaR
MKLICPLANKEKIFALLEQEDEAAGKRMQEERNVAMQQQQAATEKTKADAILALHRTKEVDSRAADVLGLADEHTARAESAKATTVRTLAEAYRIMAELDGMGLDSDKAKKEVEELREDINTEQKEIPLGEVGTPLLNEFEREGEDYGQIEAT